MSADAAETKEQAEAREKLERQVEEMTAWAASAVLGASILTDRALAVVRQASGCKDDDPVRDCDREQAFALATLAVHLGSMDEVLGGDDEEDEEDDDQPAASPRTQIPTTGFKAFVKGEGK